MKNFRKNQGITLIALVITVIVLLILAGVSIATLTGDNGLLSKAQQAKEETEKASDRDKIAMAVSEAQIGENGYQELNSNNLQEAIDNQFNERNAVVVDNGEGTFIVSLDDKIYKIENNEVSKLKADLYVSNEEDLKKFRDDVNAGNTYEGKYIVLTSNITLDINEEWEPIGYYPQTSSTPEAEENKPFCGIFNGQGYSINGLNIETQDKVKGFFGLISNGAVVENLNMGENNRIKGNLATSAIVGYAYKANIVNCQNYASIEAGSQSGGIVGILNNSVCSNSINYGKITGTTYVGGIAGSCLYNSLVKKCANNGEIVGTEYIGGIAGMTKKSRIESSTNLNAIIDNIDCKYIGGIIAFSVSSEIIECYNIGEIVGNEGIAGIVGWGYNMKINSCYNNAIITGTTKVAGICGIIGIYGEGTQNYIENCYNSKNISFSTIGGAIANYIISGEMLYCKNNYYVENTVNSSNENITIDGVILKTSEDLKNSASILGETFKEDSNNINNGYPILAWQ